MLPIRRAYTSTRNQVTNYTYLLEFQFNFDRFNTSFRRICSLQDHGHYNQATTEARQLRGSNEQEGRLAELLLASLELFSVGSVKRTVAICGSFEPVISQLLARGSARMAPVDFQLVVVWFQTLAEIYVRRSSLLDITSMRDYLVMALGLPPMFEGDSSNSPMTPEARAGSMLSRNWRQLRGLRKQYVNTGRYAEAFDLFAIAWMLYGMFDNDCKRLAALEEDYQELRELATSHQLGPTNNAIAHCWCVEVGYGADLPTPEIESQLMAIASCLPGEGARNNLEETIAAFAVLLETKLEKEAPPKYVGPAIVAEAKTMNLDNICSEVQVLDVDESSLPELHSTLAGARENMRRERLWKQVASIDKMLALQGIVLGSGVAERERYFSLARMAEAQGMGPVYLFDAQRHGHMVILAMKTVKYGADPPGFAEPMERPEITWYEGFLRRFPDYDWMADLFSAKMTLLAHYFGLNNRERVKSLMREVGEMIPGVTGFISRVGGWDGIDPAVDVLLDTISGQRPMDAPNPLTPAQRDQFMAAMGLSPQFSQAIPNFQFRGIDPAQIQAANNYYFPGIREPLGMRNQHDVINAMLGAYGLLGGPARSPTAEELERLERMVDRTRRQNR